MMGNILLHLPCVDGSLLKFNLLNSEVVTQQENIQDCSNACLIPRVIILISLALQASR